MILNSEHIALKIQFFFLIKFMEEWLKDFSSPMIFCIFTEYGILYYLLLLTIK